MAQRKTSQPTTTTQAPQPQIRQPRATVPGVYVRFIDRPSRETVAFTVENITLDGLQRAVEIGLKAIASEQKNTAGDAA